VILIAHRLESLRRCDRIAVVEAGRITALGSFEDCERGSMVFQQMQGLVGHR
jgi:ABC-type multidrug transport system fused ATPase/permease subunit